MSQQSNNIVAEKLPLFGYCSTMPVGPVLEQKSWGAKSGLARLTSSPGSGNH